MLSHGSTYQGLKTRVKKKNAEESTAFRKLTLSNVLGARQQNGEDKKKINEIENPRER